MFPTPGYLGVFLRVCLLYGDIILHRRVAPSLTSFFVHVRLIQQYTTLQLHSNYLPPPPPFFFLLSISGLKMDAINYNKFSYKIQYHLK